MRCISSNCGRSIGTSTTRRTAHQFFEIRVVHQNHDEEKIYEVIFDFQKDVSILRMRRSAQHFFEPEKFRPNYK